jgi:hypothetical protein
MTSAEPSDDPRKQLQPLSLLVRDQYAKVFELNRTHPVDERQI